MKDIDFDELDRAVTSLMGGVKPQDERRSAKTLTISSTLKDGEEPMYDKIKQAAEKIGSETILTPTENTEIIQTSPQDGTNTLVLPVFHIDEPQKDATPAASASGAVPEEPVGQVSASTQEPVAESMSVASTPRPTSGRFMDVMHPSSDMTTPAPSAETPAVTPRKRTSHEGATINVPAARETVSPVASAPESESIASSAVEESTPTELTLTAAVEAEPSQVSSIDADLSFEASLPMSDTQVQLPPAPLVSPFLPDAKVEKRPLNGAAANEQPGGGEFMSSMSLNDPDSDTQLAPTPDSEPELPEALHTDLVAIEQNFAAIMPDEEPEDKEPTISEAPAETPVALSSSVSSSDASNATNSNLDGTSDVPDIDAEEKQGDLNELASEGAIFDTSEYHKPIEHTPKHGRDWLWIVIIIAIVILCAAGAVAFYLLGA